MTIFWDIFIKVDLYDKVKAPKRKNTKREEAKNRGKKKIKTILGQNVKNGMSRTQTQDLLFKWATYRLLPLPLRCN